MPLSRTLQLLLLPPAAATLAMLLQVGSGQAQTGGSTSPQPAPVRVQLTPSQKAELFKGQKSISLRAHAEQIAILQKGERCLNDARDLEALSACRRSEWQARRELMNRTREDARALHQRLGLPLREPRGGRRGWADEGKEAI
jgi:hypothetical protein